MGNRKETKIRKETITMTPKTRWTDITELFGKTAGQVEEDHKEELVDHLNELLDNQERPEEEKGEDEIKAIRKLRREAIPERPVGRKQRKMQGFERSPKARKRRARAFEKVAGEREYEVEPTLGDSSKERPIARQTEKWIVTYTTERMEEGETMTTTVTGEDMDEATTKARGWLKRLGNGAELVMVAGFEKAKDQEEMDPIVIEDGDDEITPEALGMGPLDDTGMEISPVDGKKAYRLTAAQRGNYVATAEYCREVRDPETGLTKRQEEWQKRREERNED